MDEPPRKLGPNLQHVTQLRMTPLQRRYLLFLAAEQDATISTVLRGLIDRSLARRRVPVEGNHPDDTWPLSVVLETADDAAIEELAAQHGS